MPAPAVLGVLSGLAPYQPTKGLRTVNIRAIPTKYRGVSFRSRLEARVAYAFDRNGIEWIYEPEAFDIDGVAYLPDFWLSRAKCWIEVKPTHGQVVADDKAQALAKADGNTSVFYVHEGRDPDFPYLDNRLMVMVATGGLGSLGSAVWSHCPGCDVMQPWPLGSQEYVRCCDRWFTELEWWDRHYKSAQEDHQYGLKLPQYQDGRMLLAGQ